MKSIFKMSLLTASIALFASCGQAKNEEKKPDVATPAEKRIKH